MNEKAIFEIGDIIHVRYYLHKKLSAKEILRTHEYKQFKNNHPVLCELVER